MLLKMLVVVALTLSAANLLAAEADEFHPKAEAVDQEAQSLLQQDRKDKAERLQQVAQKLLQAAQENAQKAQRSGPKSDDAQLEEAHRRLGQQLGDLLAQERKLRETRAGKGDLAHVREQIATTERELKSVQSLRGELKQDQPREVAKQEFAGIKRRVHHLRAAAENLEKADMPELARQVYERAEKVQHDAIRTNQQLAAEMNISFTKPQKPEMNQDALRGLQEQIEQLRAEMRSLREAVGKR